MALTDDRHHTGLGGQRGLRQRPPAERRWRLTGYIELEHLNFTVGEGIGLACARHSDEPCDGARGLELARDDEVHVQVAPAPGIEIGHVGGADHYPCPRQAPHEHRGHEVRLVPRYAGQHQVGAPRPGLFQRFSAGAVPLHHADIEGVRDGLQTNGIEIDTRAVMIVVKRLDRRRAHRPGSYHDHSHPGSIPVRDPQLRAAMH